jgi:hypothetical protein
LFPFFLIASPVLLLPFWPNLSLRGPLRS